MSDPPIGSDAWRAQDKGPTIVAVCWAVTALSTVFVGARLYVRGVILRKLHSDDYYSLLGMVSGSLFCLKVALYFRSDSAFRYAAKSRQPCRQLQWYPSAMENTLPFLQRSSNKVLSYTLR